MPRSPRLLPPFDRHGLVSYRTAVDAGFDCRRLAALVDDGLLVRLRRGVYADARRWHDADPFRGKPVMRIRAALMVLRCDPVLSHDSAALLLAMGVPDPLDALVHVTRPKVHGDAVRAGVKHHLAPYAPDDVMRVEGLRVLRPARTALDLAREHGLVAGVAACDQVLRRGLARGSLEEARGRMRCWPHSTVMDEAIALADGGAESWLESEARVFLSDLGLGPCQTQFGLTDGSTTVFCDLRVGRHVFEVDGALKYDDDNPSGLPPRGVLRLEKERQDFVTGFKLGMSRITARDLRRHPDVLGARLLREYSDTCGRFGTDIGDLAPYLCRR